MLWFITRRSKTQVFHTCSDAAKSAAPFNSALCSKKGKVMAQVKIYGIREKLAPLRERLSDTIHECVMEALQLPADKRAHHFFMMEREDMLVPSGRTDAYTIVEITIMAPIMHA